jgi:hypothetical protein
MLHVDLLGRVARERDVHARQAAVLERVLPFGLIEEVVREGAVAEEQPAAPLACAARRSCTNARNGATPVPGPTMMMSRSAAGSAKVLVGLELDAHARAFFRPPQ